MNLCLRVTVNYSTPEITLRATLYWCVWILVVSMLADQACPIITSGCCAINVPQVTCCGCKIVDKNRKREFLSVGVV